MTPKPTHPLQPSQKQAKRNKRRLAVQKLRKEPPR